MNRPELGWLDRLLVSSTDKASLTKLRGARIKATDAQLRRLQHGVRKLCDLIVVGDAADWQNADAAINALASLDHGPEDVHSSRAAVLRLIDEDLKVFRANRDKYVREANAVSLICALGQIDARFLGLNREDLSEPTGRTPDVEREFAREQKGKRKAPEVALITGYLSLRAGAFGDKRKTGESEATAARRLATVYRKKKVTR